MPPRTSDPDKLTQKTFTRLDHCHKRELSDRSNSSGLSEDLQQTSGPAQAPGSLEMSSSLSSQAATALPPSSSSLSSSTKLEPDDDWPNSNGRSRCSVEPKQTCSEELCADPSRNDTECLHILPTHSGFSPFRPFSPHPTFSSSEVQLEEESFKCVDNNKQKLKAGGCHELGVSDPTVMRMSGCDVSKPMVSTHWSKVLMVTLTLVALTGYGVDSMPVSETDRAYEKLQIDTVRTPSLIGQLHNHVLAIPHRFSVRLHQTQSAGSSVLLALRPSGLVPVVSRSRYTGRSGSILEQKFHRLRFYVSQVPQGCSKPSLPLTDRADDFLSRSRKSVFGPDGA
ncbi:hypothetical protein PoB_005930900 [Plakobranchus ocellatus]|uniref:Uncharacterized protein n=1 Tax=Plakobranchus ocellatus TaxID=259542 RepID=A0AAV4CN60_9GAST|nr:hypothetical protein PoB_005930900 [Plakobranchus ocellatus]